MIRVLKVPRKLVGFRQLLHTFKSRELDEPAFHKKPIDPHILSIVKRHDPDIFYSSHIKLNKKPLTYKQRMSLMQQLGSDEFLDRLKEAKKSEPSVIAEKLSHVPESMHRNDIPAPPKEQPSIIVSETDFDSKKIEKLQIERSKLKFLTEMGLQQ